MKTIIQIIAIAVFFGQSAFAQEQVNFDTDSVSENQTELVDVLILSNGDQLLCDIISVDDEAIRYYKDDSETVYTIVLTKLKGFKWYNDQSEEDHHLDAKAERKAQRKEKRRLSKAEPWVTGLLAGGIGSGLVATVSYLGFKGLIKFIRVFIL